MACEPPAPAGGIAGVAGEGRPRYSPSTEAWLDAVDPARRKALGQYMTPAPLRARLLDGLELWPGMRVLDPGCGTGEFLRDVLDREPGAAAVGWDVDGGVLRAARALVPEAALDRRSALEGWDGPAFDLVVGNPPYAQVRLAAEERARFAEVVSGRPNLFALFFAAALRAVAPGGRVAYVVPPSMNNGAYFEALRRHLAAHGSFERVEVVEEPRPFADAQTAVQLVVLRAGRPSPAHLLVHERPEAGFRRTILTPDPAALAAEFEGRRTLWDLGYEAVTGTVVWNQWRGRLREAPERGTVPLVWAGAIGDGRLRPARAARRPGWIAWDQPLRGPAIVANRVVGAVGQGSLRCAPVARGRRFVAENHVNVVRRRRGVAAALGWAGLLAALRGPGVAERVRRLTGNTQISAAELTHMLPLDG